MANPEAVSPTQTSLRLERTFAAPREKVFRAWTDPEAFVKWFSPSDQHETRIQLDPRPGGRYSIEMKTPEGRLYRGAGTYREVRAPERLVFTWKWEHEPAGESETLVTVEFLESGSGTRLILTHERFATETSRQEHEKGWTDCLDRLQKLVA